MVIAPSRVPRVEGHCKLKNGAVGGRLDKPQFASVFLTKIEAASNRQHVIVISAIVLTPHARITSWPRRNRVIP
jgi:hypothetical protein